MNGRFAGAARACCAARHRQLAATFSGVRVIALGLLLWSYWRVCFYRLAFAGRHLPVLDLLEIGLPWIYRRPFPDEKVINFIIGNYGNFETSFVDGGVRPVFENSRSRRDRYDSSAPRSEYTTPEFPRAR